MPWNETSVMNQKAQFIADYLSESFTVVELCETYNISRKTAYKWIDRYLTFGPGGLEEFSRKPLRSPRKFEPYIEQAIIEIRKKHPTWGPKKLLPYLEKRFPNTKLPAKTTVCDILKRNNLIPKKRHRRPNKHPGKPIVQMNQPNQTWCADFKGQFRTLNGVYCYPLTITDGYSRFILACKALDSTGLDQTKAVFKGIFRKFGIPSFILTDNGTPFASCSLGRLTRLSMWWIELGITPVLIQPGNPQQNGRHERMHKTLKQETTIPPAYHLRTQQRKFNSFIQEFNFERPHEALDQQTPSQFYQESLIEYPKKIESFVYPDRFETRRVSLNAGIKWRSSWVNVSKVLADKIIGLEEIDYGKWHVYFNHVRIGILDERLMLIHDSFGQLRR